MAGACCHKCARGKVAANGWPLSCTVMILCPECGNKRCPKASDHDLACTDSNEPGQAGSIYHTLNPDDADLISGTFLDPDCGVFKS